MVESTLGDAGQSGPDLTVSRPASGSLPSSFAKQMILRWVRFSEEFSKDWCYTGRYSKSERRRVGVGSLFPVDLAPTTTCEDWRGDDEGTSESVETPGLGMTKPSGVSMATKRQMAFVTGVIVVALLTILFSLIYNRGSGPLSLGTRPAEALLIMVAYLVTDARHVGASKHLEGFNYTASWAFPAALALLLPETSFLIFVAGVTFVSGIINSKAIVRNLFNAGQAVVATFAVFEILSLFSAQRILGGSHPAFGPSQLFGLGLAFVVGSGLNHLIVGVVVGLGQDNLFSRSSWSGSILAVAQGVTLMSLGAVVAYGLAWSLWFLPVLSLVTTALVMNTYSAMKARIEQGRDDLTGLLSRAKFLDGLDSALFEASKHDQAVGYVVLNLDSFKSINDRLGHPVGDVVLRQVADRVARLRPSSGLVARLGGNEFAVVMPDISGITQLAIEARKLRDALGEPLEVRGFPLRVSASCGVALFPDHGTDSETIVRAADVAMYKAKSDKTGVEVFENATDRLQPSKVGLLGDLRYAAARGELFLVYQPKLDLNSDTVVGVEALIRWQHPVLGLVQPNDFITMAEHTELMVDLTRWVLSEALTACARWRELGFDIGVAINGSARNLHDMGFPRLVEAALVKSGVPAERLEIEITENTVMSDYRRSQLVLGELKAMGVELSVDDFGTGYSSLQHLRDLPVSTVKIDKTFVLAMLSHGSDSVIVRSIIDLSSNLGLKCVAEGVETEPILSRLRTMGCSFAQGYHIARPLSEESLLKWLSARSSADPDLSKTNRIVSGRPLASDVLEI